MLGFSGGEPFLRLKQMRELAVYASERGMPSEVVSSSAWAKSRGYAFSVLSDLASVGLQAYCTSVDRYHTPFVKAEKMRWALLAAHDAGLKVIVNSQISAAQPHRDRQSVIADVASTLQLEADVVGRWQVNPLITTPVGRARTNVDDFHYNEFKEMREGCPMATEVITLSPYGLLYPCCGMVIGEQPERADLFIQDNLTGRSVDEIEVLLGELKHDLFFKILQYAGPYALLQELKRRDPALRVRDRYVGACDACLEFTHDPAIAAAARTFLRECAEHLAVAQSGRELVADG